MLEKLVNADKVVGTRRLVRAIQAGEIAEAYIARDADLFILRQVRQACNEAGIRMIEVDTMKQLGQACGIEVPTASAGLRRQPQQKCFLAFQGCGSVSRGSIDS